MKSFLRFLCVLSLCLAPSLVWAVDGLYTGLVPVESQLEPERQEALPEALAHVLRKLSGLRELPEDPAIDAALARASDSIIAFGYQEVPQLQPDGSELDELRLEVRFAPSAVDAMVRDLALPRWRVERPTVVLWVVVDDGRGRTLTPVEYQDAYDAAEAAADYRGQPVEWPGLSQELQEQLDLQLLWGGYTDQLVADGADNAGVLVAAARREAQDWNVRWAYADASLTNSWRSRGVDLKSALVEGVNQLADLLAVSNSIGPAGNGVFRTELLLTELSGSDDYARILAYFQNLSLVDEVEVLSISPDGLRLELQMNADPEYLEDSLRVDGVLEPTEETSLTTAAYRLVP